MFFTTASSPNNEKVEKKSLADVFQEKKKAMLEKLKEKQSFRDNEKEDKERQEASTIRSPNIKKRTKEEILKCRKEMMEYGKNLRKIDVGISNPTGEGNNAFQDPRTLKEFTFSANQLKKNDPNPELLERLASGSRAKVFYSFFPP